MILTAHQPVYLPWLGLFHKIALSEVFCFFDIAQYQTRDFINRNKIKTMTGPMWLTVPVESKKHFGKKICDVKIVKNGWNRKHCRSIELSYQKSKYFKNYMPHLEEILMEHDYNYLCDLNYSILKFFLDSLGIETEIVRASDYDFIGAKSDLVLDMCVKLRASTYIFGSQGHNYANKDSFVKSGIDLHFQNYRHPIYDQLHGSFESFMSLLDLLFNMGNKSLEVLMRDNITKEDLVLN